VQWLHRLNRASLCEQAGPEARDCAGGGRGRSTAFSLACALIVFAVFAFLIVRLQY